MGTAGLFGTARILVLLLAAALMGCGGQARAEALPQVPEAPIQPWPDPSTPLSAEPPAPDPTPSPTATPAPVLVPLVPVTGFWSTERSISRSSLAATVAGTGSHPRRVMVPSVDLPSLATSLGVRPGPNVRTATPAQIRAALGTSPRALGILRAEDVTPGVRALALGGVSLFGGERVRDIARWPLLVAEPPGSVPSTYRAAEAWTLVAGGDVMLDRTVYRRTVIDGLGPDYPWSGGTARITDRYCCGYPGFRIVRGTRVSRNGAVRTLLRRADVALVNLEGPAPDDFRYHASGFTFSMDPRLLRGLRNAGIDVVSLANNHIRNWGTSGIRDTIRNLDALGIRHAGAGRTNTGARRPAWMTAAGFRIAILAYNGIGGAPRATATTAGAAGLTLSAVRTDIRAARAARADVVIVVPHWGVEYTDRLNAQQASLAPAILKAGADAVLGGHSHWAGPIRLFAGRPVVYSMGDLVFGLVHDARTQQGILVELTFSGRRVAQVTLHPTLELSVQPGILTPSGGGSALLAAIHRASDRLVSR